MAANCWDVLSNILGCAIIQYGGDLLLSQSPRQHEPDGEQSNVFLSQRKIEAARRLVRRNLAGGEKLTK
jgi:hypothetical protein